MQRLILAGLCVLAAARVVAAEPPPAIGYLPVIHKYQAGQYVGSVALDPVSTYRDCGEIVSRVIGASAEDPDAPAGTSTRGGCVPIPPAATQP